MAFIKRTDSPLVAAAAFPSEGYAARGSRGGWLVAGGQGRIFVMETGESPSAISGKATGDINKAKGATLCMGTAMINEHSR